eukprot:TRINITY_DN21320_c0_g1_i1.p1 TRINITY_DN21320_c0_g1~~TRINITY_DN21320_c0_g1_i1.p1  ORF type:complete len:134 (+),score=8.03 TRINITY_DN21320_c0_g1_i1:64-465(+)
MCIRDSSMISKEFRTIVKSNKQKESVDNFLTLEELLELCGDLVDEIAEQAIPNEVKHLLKLLELQAMKSVRMLIIVDSREFNKEKSNNQDASFVHYCLLVEASLGTPSGTRNAERMCGRCGGEEEYGGTYKIA